MNSKSLEKLRVAIVAFPWQAQAPYKFLDDILQILEPMSGKVVLIDGNTNRIEFKSAVLTIKDIGIGIHYLNEIKPKFYSAFLWIKKCFLVQLISSKKIFEERNEIDVVLFYMAYPYYLLPLLTSKFLGKKTVEVVTRSKSESLISRLVSMQDFILFRLLDGISFESNTLIKYSNINSCSHKILPDGHRFVNTSIYKQRKNIFERDKIIGFIGRLSKEKGILQFIEAIPLILEQDPEINFLIIGDGELFESVSAKCKVLKENMAANIKMTGFIKEDQFIFYLNNLKLLVFPSQHSEGLPTIILESMFSGTPVLSTSVGAVSDVIIDNQTGFIMENNSPQCISENVIRVLKCSNLNIIVENSRLLIENKYTYEATVKSWKIMLEKLIQSD